MGSLLFEMDSSNGFDANLLISETERKLGPAPRRLASEQGFTFGYWWYTQCLRFVSEKLYIVYESRNRLLREGNVALAAIVQANNELYAPGEKDRPANVVYSSDRATPDLLRVLSRCADRIFALKNTTPDRPEERKFAEMVTDECRREMRVPVPRGIAEIDGITLTTIMVFRPDLPHGYLTNGFFPLLVHRHTPATLIVPSPYWPAAISEAWELDESGLNGS